MRALALAIALAATAVTAAPTRARADQPIAGPERKLVHTDQAMGTVVQVTIWTDDEPGAAQAAQAVFAEFRRLDAMMTTWTPDSEISKINAAAGTGKAVPVSDEAYAVIARALEVSKASQGVFDITVGAYGGLWKFDEDMDGTLPDPAEVLKRKKLVNWKDVVLDKRRHTVRLKRAGMKITLGGIAKGYAVDRAAALLDKAGFASFIVQAGGDMYVSGDKNGTPWVVGVRDPRGARDQSFAVAPIKDHSFSTSGDYERAFVKDGVRYHHILDPRTAQPARASRSVTIMAKDAFTADAWSKVLFILGAKQAMALVEKLPDFDAVFVDADNHVIMSSGLKDRVKVIAEPTPGV
ncbi:MAG: FAD:protein FMN transferase [Myxococcales bacterium]|nr:FAD:protein FMN transferase [Myxococcales bacterium]MBK7195382.1 FAD:protein FMN transferase [Myxococcales bacterium]